MKINCKQLKAVLALGVRNLGLLFLVLKLGKFSFFDNFFLDLANYQDLENFSPFKLDNFWPFDIFPIFNNFSYFSINLLPPLIPPNLLVANTLLATSTYNNTVMFSIDINNVVILLKPWIICQ